MASSFAIRRAARAPTCLCFLLPDATRSRTRAALRALAGFSGSRLTDSCCWQLSRKPCITLRGEGIMTVDRMLQSKSLSLSSSQREVECPLVIIVDDDTAVREALSELVSSAGFESVNFASTSELLESDLLDRPGCLILDVRMPGASGLDLQNHLAQAGNPKPIIFLTGHGDIPMTVQAMKAGAVDFLTKPVRDQTLLDGVVVGIAADAARRREISAMKCNVERFETLTKR